MVVIKPREIPSFYIFYILLNLGFCNEFDNEIYPETQCNGHLKPLAKCSLQKPIDHVEGFMNPYKFHEEYVGKNRPLLMKNAAKLIPAFHLWSDDYLKSKTPAGKNGTVFVEIGKKEIRNDRSSRMHFTEFLNKYNTTDIYMVQDAPSYLKSDIIVPWSIQCKEYEHLLDKTVIWFSSGGTKSVLHTDSFENINCLYRGKKLLIFIDPNKYAAFKDLIIDVEDGSFSSIDVESVDLKKYPFMQDLEFQIGIMEAGDCLYIPLHWMHHVESFGSNLAVNVWWRKNTAKTVTGCNQEFDVNMSLNKVEFHDSDDEYDDDEQPYIPDEL